MEYKLLVRKKKEKKWMKRKKITGLKAEKSTIKNRRFIKKGMKIYVVEALGEGKRKHRKIEMQRSA